MYKKKMFCFGWTFSYLKKKKKKNLNHSLYIWGTKGGNAKAKRKDDLKTNKKKTLEFNISHFTLRLVALREIPTKSKTKQNNNIIINVYWYR